MLKITVDRIEGAYAVLEIGEQRIDFPLAALPEGIREGSVIEMSATPPSESVLDEAQQRLERLKASNPVNNDDIFEI